MVSWVSFDKFDHLISCFSYSHIQFLPQSFLINQRGSVSQTFKASYDVPSPSQQGRDSDDDDIMFWSHWESQGSAIILENDKLEICKKKKNIKGN